MTVPAIIRKKSLASDLGEALEWLTSLGIDFKNTRFGKYEKDIRFLEEAKPAQVPLDMHDSAAEAHDMIFIYKGLSQLDSQAFVEKLRQFVHGPPHASDEKADGASLIARNTGLELVIASHFVLGGFKIDFTTDADVVAIDGDTAFHIECKRPLKSKTLKKNLDSAYRQLRRRYDEYQLSAGNRGLVVISIGKAIDAGNRTLGVKEYRQSIEVLGDVTNNFLTQNRALWNRNLHPNTVGVFAYLQLGVQAQDQLGTGFVRHFAGIYIRRGHATDIKYLDPDRLYFREIVTRLNDGARKALESDAVS